MQSSLEPFLSWHAFQLSLRKAFCNSSLFTGLMADKLGSYAATFYTAGAVLIAGASIISLMAFAKQKREEFVRMELNDDEELLVTEKLTVL